MQGLEISCYCKELDGSTTQTQMTGPLNPNNQTHDDIILQHTHAPNSRSDQLQHHGERLCHSEVHQTDMKSNKAREQKHEVTWSLIIKQH